MVPTDDLDRIMAVMAAAFDPVFGEAWNRRQVEDALIMGNCHYGLAPATGDCAGFYLSRFAFDEEESCCWAYCPGIAAKDMALNYLNNLSIARGCGELGGCCLRCARKIQRSSCTGVMVSHTSAAARITIAAQMDSESMP